MAGRIIEEHIECYIEWTDLDGRFYAEKTTTLGFLRKHFQRPKLTLGDSWDQVDGSVLVVKLVSEKCPMKKYLYLPGKAKY